MSRPYGCSGLTTPIKKRRPGGRTGAALWQTVASRGDICLPKKRIDNRDKKSKRKSSKQRKEYGPIRAAYVPLDSNFPGVLY